MFVTFLVFPEDCFFAKQTVQPLMKCYLLPHFIWVLTVCQSTHLLSSRKKKVTFYSGQYQVYFIKLDGRHRQLKKGITLILRDISLTVKDAALIFISGRG